jgi:hypothetical protein
LRTFLGRPLDKHRKGLPRCQKYLKGAATRATGSGIFPRFPAAVRLRQGADFDNEGKCGFVHARMEIVCSKTYCEREDAIACNARSYANHPTDTSHGQK